MATQASKLIPSGTEPVDATLGGLAAGGLYLAHGDTAGKSLFGIRFLIEGLKRGESGALIIQYSPEDAVRRFARLGYDCLEDIYSGRLIILEYSADLERQMGRLDGLAPVLRELEWLLSEARPRRLVFDPAAHLIEGPNGDAETRAREFAEWASLLEATVVLIANGHTEQIVRALKPRVQESFRFELRESEERATRFLVFEKSANLPDFPIEVDPARGIFMLGRGAAATPEETDPIEVPAMPVDDGAVPAAGEAPLDEAEDAEAQSATAASTASQPTVNFFDFIHEMEEVISVEDLDPGDTLEWPGESGQSADPPQSGAPAAPSEAEESPEAAELSPESPLDLDDELPQAAATDAEPAEEMVEPEVRFIDSAPHIKLVTELISPPTAEAEVRDEEDEAQTGRVVELLLRPPDAAGLPDAQAAPGAAHHEIKAVNPKDFNVLVIDDEPLSRELLGQALGEYTVEMVSDGISGLAKLISFKPDLIVLDSDLPVVDGFKVLAHIRTSLNMPVVVMSGSRMRASDRVLAAELGADYYLTKPFSIKELRFKARQLIARYRNITSWIVTANAEEAASEARDEAQARAAERVLAYPDFIARVEERVRAGAGAALFAIVGCRLPQGNGERNAALLSDLVQRLVRETDCLSTNTHNDVVILLADADPNGARAFINRLRERVAEEFHQEPSVWTRFYPEAAEAEARPLSLAPADTPNRRASDRLRG